LKATDLSTVNPNDTINLAILPGGLPYDNWLRGKSERTRVLYRQVFGGFVNYLASQGKSPVCDKGNAGDIAIEAQRWSTASEVGKQPRYIGWRSPQVGILTG